MRGAALGVFRYGGGRGWVQKSGGDSGWRVRARCAEAEANCCSNKARCTLQQASRPSRMDDWFESDIPESQYERKQVSPPTSASNTAYLR